MIPNTVMARHPLSPALIEASLNQDRRMKLEQRLQALSTRAQFEAQLHQELRRSEADPDFDWLKDPRHGVVTLLDPLYPPLLKVIPDPPLVLWVAGQFDLLLDPALAITGSQTPTSGGVEEAAAFSDALGQRGLTIVSGLSAGIEASAHAHAVPSVGRTIGVLNHGPDRIYPKELRDLAQNIRDQGLLLSEHPPGTRLQKERPSRRNRIISGLSMGVLVIEAELTSPSLQIAEAALEQGREVFAVPGSIHSPQKKGCHRLIRQGASLVETAQDVLQHLHPHLSHLNF